MYCNKNYPGEDFTTVHFNSEYGYLSGEKNVAVFWDYQYTWYKFSVVDGIWK